MTSYIDINPFYSNKNIKSKPVNYNMEDIKTSLLRLFSTRIGSVPFNRNYGSHLYNMLFENTLDVHDVRMFLYMDIQEFEPRIQLSPMDIDIQRVDEHTYQVSCSFIVPDLNNEVGSVEQTVTDQG